MERFWGTAEEYRADGSVLDRQLNFDYTDTTRTHVFVFKGLGEGPFPMELTFRPETLRRSYRYRGELDLRGGSFHRLRWPRIAETVPEGIGLLKAELVAESDVRSLAPNVTIPSCAEVLVGLSWTP